MTNSRTKHAKKALKIVGLIPARHASSRFPGKPLADINGKPMIWWTYTQAKKSKLLTHVVVAAHDKKIAEGCKELGIPYVLTEATRFTGTDNISVAAKSIPADIYINIQGDEPMIDPNVIDTAIKAMLADPSIRVLNLMAKITKMHEVTSSTVPKVVVNRNGDAVFFSRLPIPFPKTPCENYFKQVCVYGFRPEALRIFSDLPQGLVEEVEEIELLRFMESGIPVRMIEVVSENIAVDTPSDLAVVSKIMRQKMTKRKK